MIADRLREAPAEVQDVFASARAHLQAAEVTGQLSDEGLAAITETFMLRMELGWDRETE